MIRCHRSPRTERFPQLFRHVTLPGTRVDALEHLPAFCHEERLELGAGTMSLVGERTRVDVHVVAETGTDPARAEVSLVLLALTFEGRSEQEADRFVARLRHRARLATGCH